VVVRFPTPESPPAVVNPPEKMTGGHREKLELLSLNHNEERDKGGKNEEKTGSLAYIGE
jgi:hypothetical protein